MPWKCEQWTSQYGSGLGYCLTATGSPCPCGFPPGTLVSSHHPKICWYWGLLIAACCEWVCMEPCDELDSLWIHCANTKIKCLLKMNGWMNKWMNLSCLICLARLNMTDIFSCQVLRDTEIMEEKWLKLDNHCNHWSCLKCRTERSEHLSIPVWATHALDD